MPAAVLAFPGLIVAPLTTHADVTNVSAVSKTGTDEATGDTVTSGGPAGTANPGDTIKWVVNYQNRTGVRANVTVSDPILAGQSYVAGSLQQPPEWSVTPTATAMSGSAGSVPPSGAATMVFANSGNALQQPAGGDGFNVVINPSQPNNVYTLFHHNRASIACVAKGGGRCAGWTAGVLYFDPANPTGPLVTATPATNYTSNHSSWAALDANTGRAYETVETAGIGTATVTEALACYDTVRLTGCGVFQSTPSVPANSGATGIDGATGVIQASNRLMYWASATAAGAVLLHCLDPATNTSCPAGDGLQLLPAGTAANPVFNYTTWGDQNIQSWDHYVFVTQEGRSGSTATTFMQCYDTAARAICAGWPATGGFANAATSALILPMLDAQGSVTGVCKQTAAGVPSCWGVDGAAIASAAIPAAYKKTIGNSWTGNSLSYWYQEVAALGSRVYYQDSTTNLVACYDFATAAACQGFNYTTPNFATIKAYTLVTDPLNPTCIWENGDTGQIVPIDAITGTVGCSVVGTVTGTPAANYCDGRQRATSWQSLAFTAPPSNQFGQYVVTIRDAHGVAVTDSAGVVWSNRVVASTANPIDISAIGYGPQWSNGRGGTYDTTTLTASVNLTGATASFTTPPAATLTWSSDGSYQYCYETKVDNTCVTGTVSNTTTIVTNATANGGASDAPGGNSSGPASFRVAPTEETCGLHVTKTSAASVLTGDVLRYTLRITNTGTANWTAANPAVVTDDLSAALRVATFNRDQVASAGSVSYAAPVLRWTGPLAAGASVTVTYSLTATTDRAAVDAAGGAAVNSVTTPASVPSNCPADDPCDVRVPVLYTGLTVTKTADQSGFVSVGDELTYHFLVTNTGTAPLSALDVTDEVQTASGPVEVRVDCPVSSLAAGASTVCRSHAPYVVTLADVGAGGVTDTARATGTPPSGASVTTPPSTVTVPALFRPAVTIEKVGSLGSVKTVGQQARFTFVVRNTGNVALTDVAVADVYAAPASPSAGAATVACPDTSLPVGATMVCTTQTPYVVTAADLAHGSVDNTATVTAVGTAIGGGTQAVSFADTWSVPAIVSGAGLAVRKFATPVVAHNVGDVLQFDYVVSNTGAEPVAGIGVVDTFTNGTRLTASCPLPTLRPQEQETCTSPPYLVTAADVTAGRVANTATAAATANGTPVSATSNAVTVPVLPAPSLELVKSASPMSVREPGQTVSYVYDVTNTGNTALNAVAVTDRFSGGAAATVTCPRSVLAAGESMRCTAPDYTVTQADIDAGSVTDTASASATAPSGTTVTSPRSAVTVTADATAALVLTKVADRESVHLAGDIIRYTLTLTNTGGVTLFSPVASEELAPPAVEELSPVCSLASGASLAPGASTTCTAAYRVTQADIDNGSVANTAVARAQAGGGATVTSNTATATVDAPHSASLSLVKTATPASFASAGTPVTFSYRLTNTGNLDIDGLAAAGAVTDPLPGLGDISCPRDELRPGASQTCTASYTTTQDDMDTGRVSNTASVTGQDPDGHPVPSNASTATVPRRSAAPSIAMVKTASPAAVARPGDTVTYTFTIINTGGTALNNVAVTDVLAAPATAANYVAEPCPTSLAVGAVQTCTASYTTTQDDIDHGRIADTATASGASPAGVLATSPAATATVTAPVVTGVELTKVASRANGYRVGDRVSYAFTVTNTGNVTQTSVSLADMWTAPANGPQATCPATSLAAGSSMTCTADYTITAADVTAGSVTNSATATASGTAATGPFTVTSTPRSTTVPIPAAAALTLIKTATPITVSTVGEVIHYTFTVANGGNAPLSGVAIADAGLNAPAICPQSTLAVGQSQECTGSHTVTAADLAAGQISNTATVTGLDPAGTAVVSPTSTTMVEVAAGPAISITKVGDVTLFHHVGDRVTYTITVTNTGNRPVHDVRIADAQASPAGAPVGAGGTPVSASSQRVTVDCPAGTLAVGASLDCTATYTATQADVDSGAIHNTAAATASPPTGPPVQSPQSTWVVQIPPTPGLSITKSAASTAAAAGDRLTYSFVVANTGNVSLDHIAVTDTLAAPAGPALTITCPRTSLGDGESMTCTAPYTVSQADADHGAIDNSAAATGTPPIGPAVTTPPSPWHVTIAPAPALAVVKSVAAGPVPLTVGQELTYTFVATNTGNVTLSDVRITEGAFTGSGALSPPTCPPGPTSLAPGEQVTCTATYTITQADVDRGTIDNDASAGGTPPTGSRITSPPGVAHVPEDQNPDITVVKTATPATVAAAGERVSYSFLVTNTGNVTLTDVAVNETAFSGNGAVPAIQCPVGPITLAPGQRATCTATYTVTQADVDAGTLTDTAAASGTPPVGAPVMSAPSTAVVTATPTPALTVAKSVAPATVSAAGQTVTYTFLVTNTGNVTLTDVTVADTGFSGTGTPPVPTCPSGPLAPGATVTCTATYPITQSDVDAGRITNTATASGAPPTGARVTSPPSDAGVTAPSAPDLTIAKTVTPATVAAAGARLSYSFVVTNTGNVTLTGVAVGERAFSGTGPAPTLDCPASLATLAPSATATCTAEYTVTQSDVDAGRITNAATATGTPPTGPAVTTPPSSAEVTAPATPTLTVVKTATPATVAAAGDRVTYAFLVTNTGNVTLTTVSVAETAFSGTGERPFISCPTAARSLAPGDTVTCVASYTVTQADVDTGTVTDTATATGTPPSGPPVTSPPSSADVTAPAAPALTVVKSATPAAVNDPGDRIAYSFVVTNTGNVTLTAITVNETAFSGTGTPPAVDCPPGPLAPGATVTCTAAYAVTQSDVDVGVISDTATATGTPPAGVPVESGPSTAVVTAPSQPELRIVKTALPGVVHVAGDRVVYAFRVTNSGNVTLTDIAVTDTEFSGTGGPPGITCPPEAASLPAHANVTCTATYTVTDADLDHGSITNTAIATGTPPTGPAVNSLPWVATVGTSRAVQPAPRAAVTVTKAASPTVVRVVGGRVTYRFVVTNTGDTTLTGVGVDDVQAPPAGPLTTDPTCPRTVLAPGQRMTCTATYVVTRADLINRRIRDTATAHGTVLGQTTRVRSGPASTSVSVFLTQGAVPAGGEASGPGGTQTMPTTGTALAPTGAWALITTVLGGLLVIASRRRRPHDHV